MSASLVGSEMCIRDRPLPASSDQVITRFWRVLGPVDRALPESMGCLLYTSDAADDMQCVEL
eukprot:8393107-Alexandrium_andersonii.AAC.1